MNTLKSLYNHSLALLTDFYQLTMAYSLWKSAKAGYEGTFDLYFRANPFHGGYTIACGLQTAIDYIKNFHFSGEDVDYLATLKGNDDAPLFSTSFLDYLRNLRLTCNIDAVPEGTVVFPNQPLVRVSGPIIQCQLLETPMLNIINFQTLIASKASRICQVTSGEPVLEFGLRRAHGIDGATTASRAAYIGGVDATSNVLAGKLYDIPVRGTHAHSWIMTFDNELEAFDEYAKAMPNNCVLLVDTYDTIKGVHNAVEIGKKLREKGFDLAGIRLDSGDLAYLSIQARRILDEGGFPNTAIVASNDLDENIILSLKDQDAQITVWGVGTKLATAWDQPALGGVYKLTALRAPGGEWQYKIKLSEQREKVSNPGIHQIRRFQYKNEFIADAIYDERISDMANPIIVDPMDHTRQKLIHANATFEDLLKPVFRNGDYVYDAPDIHTSRRFAQEQLTGFHTGIKRFVNPHQYPVGLERKLHQLKTELIFEARRQNVGGNQPGAPESQQSKY
ncbi:MAG: nicotinate phosphoribosyltransferase [Deferribacteres bacterium]|nr:nicotinate phosphoribosyltransferase [candidate division KSB1 bacterium]MCB9503443.1 nicotinate phosphoribosyltransferase [Deferribacteres bacterium]